MVLYLFRIPLARINGNLELILLGLSSLRVVSFGVEGSGSGRFYR